MIGGSHVSELLAKLLN